MSTSTSKKNAFNAQINTMLLKCNLIDKDNCKSVLTFTFVRTSVKIEYQLPFVPIPYWDREIAERIRQLALDYYDVAVVLIITDSMQNICEFLDPNLVIVANPRMFKGEVSIKDQSASDQYNICLINKMEVTKRIVSGNIFVTRVFSVGRYLCLEGVDENGKHIVRKTNFTSGIWVSENVLRSSEWFLWVKGVINIYRRNLSLKNTSFTVNDFLSTKDVMFDRNFIFIETENWHTAMNIYRFINMMKINKQRIIGNYHKYITFGLWDPNILFHLELCELWKSRDQDLPTEGLVYSWLDDDYNEIAKPPPKINCISFDIETVTHNESRIPLGDLPDDVIYIICAAEDNTNTIHTWYLGAEELNDSFMDDARNEFDKSERDRVENFMKKKKLITQFNKDADATSKVLDQGEDVLKPFNIKMHRFTSEKLMLEDFVNYLQRDELILLSAHNGRWYDYPVIALRYRLLNCKNWESLLLELDGCPVFGTNLIPFDSYIYALNNYEMERYNLDSVVNILLDRSKADVSAVAIRFLWKTEQGLETKHKYPSKAQSVYYCKVDAALVLILLRTQPWVKSLYNQCKLYLTNINHLQSNEVKETRKILACLFIGALNKKKMFSYTHNGKMFRSEDGNIQCYDDMKYTEFKRGRITTNYTGGLNWFDRSTYYKDVSVNDYQQFFPCIISVHNLSPETTLITTPRELSFRGICMEDFITSKKISIWIFSHYKHTNPKLCEAMIRMNLKKMSNEKITTYAEYLKLPENQPIVVIIDSSILKGYLSEIVTKFVSERANLKQCTKNLKEIVNAMECKINDPVVEKEEDCFDFGDDEEEEDPYEECIRKLSDGEAVDCQSYLQVDRDRREEILKLAKIQMESVEGTNRTLKVIVSAFYGAMGSTRINFSAITIASAAVCISKHLLISICRGVYSKGDIVTYMDTDSAFVVSTVDSIPGSSVAMLAEQQNQEIRPKDKDLLVVLHKKCYVIESCNTTDSRGVNRNGPICVRNFYYAVLQEMLDVRDDISLPMLAVIFEKNIKNLYADWVKDPYGLMTKNTVKTLHEYPTSSMYYKMISAVEKEFPGLVVSGTIRHFPVITNSILTSQRFHELFLPRFPLSALNLFILIGSIGKMIAKVAKNLLDTKIRRVYFSAYTYDDKNILLLLAQSFKKIVESITYEQNLEYLKTLSLSEDEAKKVIENYEMRGVENFDESLLDKEINETDNRKRQEQDIDYMDIYDEW